MLKEVLKLLDKKAMSLKELSRYMNTSEDMIKNIIQLLIDKDKIISVKMYKDHKCNLKKCASCPLKNVVKRDDSMNSNDCITMYALKNNYTEIR